MANNYRIGTKVIHAGQPAEPTSGAVILPISLSTTFLQPSPNVLPGGYDYSRSGNPTRKALEECLAAAENAKYALTFASGLATLTTIINSLQSGDEVISVDDVYGGTRRYMSRVAANFGMKFSFVDMSNLDQLAAAFTEKTKLVWLETPTNPLLKVADIKLVADFVHSKNAILVVDNTFMSPYFQNPLDLGADIVMHSITKYINGHSDVVMGCLATNDEALYAKLKFLQNSIGAVPSPFDCFLAIRGIKTLHVRMREHEKNAFAVCKFLESHPKVDRVIYPGLPSHPQHEICKRQMKGYGGMVVFFCKGGLDESKKILENLKVFALAESLGGVESLVELPSLMTHASVPLEERIKLGITDTLIRLSVGIEDVNDLIADLSQALDKI
ncbi:cystathionine gamma-lyase [Heterostelium album PN500]|uniref:cystathionine gamma-lyase n=1 Tax=Heterostelium pallidum (strain ATCC 26659 / Pp 5 / PN500) TaxID=670386 RepID=D3BFM3_HETP5|nr:cystathionine gamma-lyase [Heterostelium album PN500]EFA79937.1 cystathionine gamma-lyase [Heterostelium album PN500]|eukprot:XP_020432057.1 cystathionine gamma-lyase [Heterostelium album PN500]